MKMQLLLATANPSKVRELTAALADFEFEIRTLADFPELKLPAETGETFEENAKIKAEFCARETGLDALADDSGILVDALPGELGVRTVRFGAGENASDAEWLAHFLERMSGAKNRRARFISVLALANICKVPACRQAGLRPDYRRDTSLLRRKELQKSPFVKGGSELCEQGDFTKGDKQGDFIETEFFRGEVDGEILPKPDAPILPRIPLSSVFRADGAGKVFAAMSPEEKEKFSHRGRAIEKFKKNWSVQNNF